MIWEPHNSGLIMDKVFLRLYENGHKISKKKNSLWENKSILDQSYKLP